ncbi:MAG: hypothetical protein IJ958_10485 [Agathobacter sp.]|nr:hypothetical protein [Agathobacter sp.]
MKNLKYVIIGIACICLICVGFYFFSQEHATTEKDLTEVEKVMVRKLDENYPKTPREVVKFYNRIISCYYGEELTEEQLNKLVDQMMCLLDEDLLIVNPRDEYYNSIVADIELYKKANKSVVSTDVCDSNEVKYVDDVKEGTSEVDKIAYVDASYFVNEDGDFVYSYQQFVLRQDDDGRWKIITFYEIGGDPSDHE